MNNQDKAELEDIEGQRRTSKREHDTDETPPPHTNYPDDALVAETQKPGHLKKP